MNSNTVVLDHIALAADTAWDNFDRYRGDLGGVWFGGMEVPGFYWGQVQFANGMVVEMLQPANVHLDDFLRRFLDRSGDGPHHLTFKVPDIVAAMDRATAAGFPPVRSDLSQDFWKEAFLHPKQCHGIVVQLAQASHHPRDDEVQHHALPPARVAESATFDRIVHLVADLQAALMLYRDVLQGTVVAQDSEPDGSAFCELKWPGPGRLLLRQPADLAERAWLGDRTGRTHHLEFAIANPHTIRDAKRLVSGWWEIAPESNHGVRLRIKEA